MYPAPPTFFLDCINENVAWWEIVNGEFIGCGIVMIHDKHNFILQRTAMNDEKTLLSLEGLLVSHI